MLGCSPRVEKEKKGSDAGTGTQVGWFGQDRNLSMSSASVDRGSLLIHRSGAWAVVRNRKDDDSGWWLVGGGGIADHVLAGDDWFTPTEGDLRNFFIQGCCAPIDAR